MPLDRTDPRERLMESDGLAPFPRSLPGGCFRCGGPTNIYEKDLQDTPDGLICGDCTRAENRRKGRDPRQLKKQHMWKHGHDPADDEATPESDFQYVTLEVHEQPEMPNQKEGLNGPPSYVWCFNCLGRGRKVMTRLVAVVDPYELLVPMGYKVDEHTIKTKEKDIVTICPECTSATHWKESQYEIERARNINA